MLKERSLVTGRIFLNRQNSIELLSTTFKKSVAEIVVGKPVGAMPIPAVFDNRSQARSPSS